MALVMAAGGLLVSHPVAAVEALSAQVISSRADTITGGDALVKVNPAGQMGWNARLNGKDVTSLFQAAGSSGAPIALLTGLKVGKNALRISVPGAQSLNLHLYNHPLTGPVFSGPQQQPFICQTAKSGLGPPFDANCSAKVVVRYYYKSRERGSKTLLEIAQTKLAPKPGGLEPGFKAYDVMNPPDLKEVAETVTSDGHTVPYIVRWEVGTINRAIYDIQFLHQPDQPLPTPWKRPDAGWNGRLVYYFGGGCGGGYVQGTLQSIGPEQEPALSQGFAIATSSLNVFGNRCSDVVAAETLSMVKERFIEQFGEPAYTIGVGASGGAVQQHLIAANYPGLLDGIITELSYPDAVTTAASVTDCALLGNVFDTSTAPWSDEQKSLVSGFATWRTCSEGWG